MRNDYRTAVIIPAINEAQSIAKVIAAIPDWVDDIIVADNGSTDGTPEIATAAGARVVHEPRRGYGSACLCGIAHLENPDIVVFLDGDYSDHPEEMDQLVDPILAGEVEMVIGSRARGVHERGALTPQAAFGNWLATRLIRLFWGVRYTDLGPFRAIRYATLLTLGMRDPDYGWTVEMQIRAALHRVPTLEVPVQYRKRIGVSKVSGTVRGVIGASYKILGTIAVAALFGRYTPSDQRLVLFSRWPEPGVTKTRLIPALGPEGAAALQREMTTHILSAAPPPDFRTAVQVRYTGAKRAALRDWLGAAYDYMDQGGGGLGERMECAFAEEFEDGYGKVLLIGADCPAITSQVVLNAFAALKDADLVMGPALDGGYYLIGLRIEAAGRSTELLEGVDWGTETVLEQTTANAERIGLRHALLEVQSDVDVPEDLPAWEAARDSQRISVILPVLDEATLIGPALERLQGAENVEIIVADGGSTDDTVGIARQYEGVQVLETAPGRAQQMNEGAARATGALLLFLHADTRLPPRWQDQVRRTAGLDGMALGAFRFQVDGRGPGFHLIEWGVNLRSTWLHLPYGDQAFFFRRAIFEASGGFPRQPIMEDIELVRRCRQLGALHIVDAPVTTSARRWEKHGRLKTTLRNMAAALAYTAGVAPEKIAAWYRKER